MPPPLACTFSGTAAEVHLRGSGAAVFVDPVAFSGAGAAHVGLSGVKIGAVGAAKGKLLMLERPTRLEPVGPNAEGAKYDVTYRAGPPVVVQIDVGGLDTGTFRGRLADAPDCVMHGCEISWGPGAKAITLERVNGAPVVLSGAFPLGDGEGDPRAKSAASVKEIALTSAVGQLRCQSGAVDQEPAWIDGEDLVFEAGEHAALGVDPIRLEARSLGVLIANEAPPRRVAHHDVGTVGGWPVIAAWGSAGLMGVFIAVGLLVRRRRRVAAVVRAQVPAKLPIGVTSIEIAPEINAFPPPMPMAPPSTSIRPDAAPPSTSMRPGRPITHSDAGPPSTSMAPAPLSTSIRPPRPITYSDAVPPSTSMRPGRPITYSDAVPPSTSMRPARPITYSDAVPPSTSMRPARPITQSDAMPPSTSMRPSRPITQSDAMPPSTSMPPAPPGTSIHPRQPAVPNARAVAAVTALRAMQQHQRASSIPVVSSHAEAIVPPAPTFDDEERGPRSMRAPPLLRDGHLVQGPAPPNRMASPPLPREESEAPSADLLTPSIPRPPAVPGARKAPPPIPRKPPKPPAPPSPTPPAVDVEPDSAPPLSDLLRD